MEGLKNALLVITYDRSFSGPSAPSGGYGWSVARVDANVQDVQEIDDLGDAPLPAVATDRRRGTALALAGHWTVEADGNQAESENKARLTDNTGRVPTV